MTPKELRSRRLALALSVSEVARELGMPVERVREMESGDGPLVERALIERTFAKLRRPEAPLAIEQRLAWLLTFRLLKRLLTTPQRFDASGGARPHDRSVRERRRASDRWACLARSASDGVSASSSLPPTTRARGPDADGRQCMVGAVV